MREIISGKGNLERIGGYSFWWDLGIRNFNWVFIEF